MGGLLMLFVIAVWASISVVAAFGVAKVVPGSDALKACAGIMVAAILFVAPVADDFIGQRQFENYCHFSEEVRILGTVSGGSELYTPDGSWRLAHYSPAQADENTRLVRLADSLVRWDHGTAAPVQDFPVITKRHTRIFDRNSDSLVAEWDTYGYAGGFLRAGILQGGGECFPRVMRQSGYGLYNALIPNRK